MKKIIATLLAFAGITASLTGCSDSPDSSSQPKVRTSTAPIDTAIIGKWWNGTSGYVFGEDRKVNLVMDFSAMDIHFTSDGEFDKAGEIIGKDAIAYDGKELIVYYTIDEDVSKIVHLERKDGENPDSIDGSYTLYGGLLTEYFIGNVGLSIDNVMNDDNISLGAEIDGESFILTIENYCDYETINGALEMFSPYMSYVDNNVDCVRYSYSVDGDTLNMKYTMDETAPDEVYSRVEE